MRLILKIFVGILVGGFFLGCLSWLWQFRADSSRSVAADSDRDDLNYRERIYYRDIYERLESTDILPLNNSTDNNTQTEVRIWFGFSTLPLKGIILKQTDERSSAIYVHPRKPGSLCPCTTELPSPGSGWDSIWQKFDESNLATNAQPELIPKIDQGGFIVETKINGKYRAHKYVGAEGSSASSFELIRFVRMLNTEFGVDLLLVPDFGIAEMGG